MSTRVSSDGLFAVLNLVGVLFGLCYILPRLWHLICFVVDCYCCNIVTMLACYYVHDASCIVVVFCREIANGHYYLDAHAIVYHVFEVVVNDCYCCNIFYNNVTLCMTPIYVLFSIKRISTLHRFCYYPDVYVTSHYFEN